MTEVLIRALRPEHADACDRIVLGLPYHFGIEDGRRDCAAAVRRDAGLVAVEHPDAGLAQDLPDLVLLAALEVVVAQHADHRDAHRAVDLARQALRLLGQAVVGQVAAEHQHVRVAAGPGLLTSAEPRRPGNARW